MISRLIWRTQQILQSQIKLLYRVEDVQFMALHNFVLKIKKSLFMLENAGTRSVTRLDLQLWRRTGTELGGTSGTKKNFHGTVAGRLGTEIRCIFLNNFTSEKLSHV